MPLSETIPGAPTSPSSAAATPSTAATDRLFTPGDEAFLRSMKIDPSSPPPLDENNLNERANKGYFRDFWGAYKGHVLGMLTGIAVLAPIAAAIGGVLFFAMPLLGFPIFAAAGVGVGTVMAAFAAVGGVMGSEGFGAVGSAAHVRATSLAEKHARDWIREPGFEKGKGKFYDMPFYEGLYGHHYEIPPNRDAGVFFHWKSGLIGALALAGVGALFAAGGLPFGAHLLAAHSLPIFASVGALFGATYGINRAKFRSFFNLTDGWSHGKAKLDTAPYPLTVDPHLPPAEQEKQREQQRTLFDTQMKRQALIYHLEDKYYSSIFWSGINGRFSGFAGGPLLGVLVGGAVGLAALAAATALGVTAAPLIALGFAGAGAHLAADIFTDAGTQAGTESMAKAIDEEHYHNLRLIREGKQPEYKIIKEDKSLFNWKAALACAAIGAVVGVPLFGILGAGILNLFPAAVLPGLVTTVGAKIAASSLVCSMVGMTYGIKLRHLKKVGNFANDLYAGKIFGENGTGHEPHHELPAPEQVKTPEPAPSITPDDMQKLNAALARNNTAPGFAQRLQAPLPGMEVVR